MNDFFQNLTIALEHLKYTWYLIVIFVSFLESIILTWYFIPWSTIIIIFWMLAWLDYYNLWDVLFFSIIWNIFWNLTSFYLWRKVWIKALKNWFLFIKANHFKNADLFFEKHGWKSIFLWKLIPWIKESIPFVVGILNMNIYKFLFWNIIWAVVWGIIFVWVWYIFSSSLSLAEIWITRFGYFILIITLLFWIFYLIKFLIIKFWKWFINLLLDLFQFFRERFLFNNNVIKFTKNHKNLINFLNNRFRKKYFLGLPLTVLIIILFYVSFEYIWFIDAIFDNDLITQIDIRLSDFFFYFKDIRLINFFLFISYFWNTIIVALITSISIIILFLKWKKIEIFWLISSVLITVFLTILSKILIARPRPELMVYNEIGFSFPSFHATISISLYGFLIWLIIRKTNKWKKKINYVFIWILISFLIWFSRLYLNVHYLSDVIWWYFLWFLWFIFWITIVWFLDFKCKKNIKFIKNKFYIYLIYIFISLWIFFSFYYYHIYYNNIYFTNIPAEKYIKINNILNFFNKNPNFKYTETITWRRTEPINFIFVLEDDNTLINILQKSWYVEADKIWRYSIKKMWDALLKNIPYNNAPITPLYWNKQIQTFWFQKLTEAETIKFRHHIRIWKTSYKINNKFIYIWCWLFDDWLKWGITHKISENIDIEREYIFEDIKNSWIINNYLKIQLEDPFNWNNFSWDKFFTDWKVYIIK